MNKNALNSMPDEELVRLARCSDGDAVQELLGRVYPFILYKSRQFGQGTDDSQDYAQEGVVGFLSAIHSFKTDGGAKFTTYACTCALNRMRSLLRQRSRNDDYITVPLNSGDDIEDFRLGPEDRLQAQDEADNIMLTISQRLSAYEKQVIHFYLKGDCYADIAEKTGTNAKSVDNAMQRIRRKLS